MSESVIMVAAKWPVSGREAEWGNRWYEFKGALDKWKAAGKIARFEHVRLHPYLGDLTSFYLIVGDRVKLDELRRTSEFEQMVRMLGLDSNGLGILTGTTELLHISPDMIRMQQQRRQS